MEPAFQEQRFNDGSNLYQILVVDDCSLSIEALQYVLADRGHSVVSARCGEEAIGIAHVLKPDIILLDLKMPGLGGIRTLQALKTRSTTEHIPIIIVSSSDADVDIARALDLGAHDYVVKPINNLVLTARIRSALRCSRVQGRRKGPNIY